MKKAEEIFIRFTSPITKGYSDYIIRDREGFIKAIEDYHLRPIEPQEPNVEQNILQIAYKITETIYNEKNSMECFGNFEVRMQELLLKYFNSVSAKNAYTESIEPQEERIPNTGKTIELREELISFARQFYADEETCIHNVDEYLTNKKS